ncbi:MAG TPA: hypothetical protein VMM35_09340, partial [Longimicrobiales bacterium]|nr:hypothetical protein [Longimicrobiales bacterium]
MPRRGVSSVSGVEPSGGRAAEMLPEDRWVKAAEFRAGSSAVHHIIADPLGGIAPGVEPTMHPDGYATVLRAGHDGGCCADVHRHEDRHSGP